MTWFICAGIWQNLFMQFANNKDENHHPCSPISICLLSTFSDTCSFYKETFNTLLSFYCWLGQFESSLDTYHQREIAQIFKSLWKYIKELVFNYTCTSTQRVKSSGCSLEVFLGGTHCFVCLFVGFTSQSTLLRQGLIWKFGLMGLWPDPDFMGPFGRGYGGCLGPHWGPGAEPR